MITISHFHFGLIIFLVGVFSVAVLIAILEILGREAIAKPEPETLCPHCHLLFTKSGQSRAVATGHCLRCETRDILSAANDLAGNREKRTESSEDRAFVEGL